MKISNITKEFNDNNRKVVAINDVSITFPHSGMVFITGKSGSGKSTLLYILGGLIFASSGVIEYPNQNISIQNTPKHIGFVFQNFNLFNDLTVRENIKIAAEVKDYPITVNEIETYAKMLDIEPLIDQKVANLSGGEQQRVAIARALVAHPYMILADEPTGNLDDENAIIVYESLKSISRDKLVICVTHDLQASQTYGDRIINLKSGHVETDLILKESSKKVEEIYHQDYKIESSKRKLALKFANKHLFEKKLRLTLTIISIVIASLLLLLSISLSNYDERKVVSRYLEDYQINNYTFYENNSYQDLFDDNITKQIYSSKQFYQHLSQYFPQENITKIELDVMAYSLSKTVNAHFYNNEKIFNPSQIHGNLPSQTNDILISDYLAFAHDLSIGSEILMYSKVFTISGIFTTDYESQNYRMRSSLSQLNQYDYHQEKNQYFVVYLPTSHVDILKNQEVISIKGSGSLSRYPSITSQSLSSTNLASIIPNRAPSFGRLPEHGNQNEVIISSRLALEKKLLENGVFKEESFSFFDLHQAQFNGAYDNYINLYDYFKTGIKVVGTYDDDESMTVYLAKNTFDEIKEEYFTYYYFDELAVENYQVIDKTFLLKLNPNVYIDEPGVKNIYTFTFGLRRFSLIMNVLLILFLILALFLLITTLLNTFYSGQKDIAILTSLGLNRQDINKIFLYQSLEIFMIGALGLLFSYLIAIEAINQYYDQIYKHRKITIYLFDTKMIMYTLLGVLVVALFFSYLIMRKIKKSDMIQVLKNE